MGGHPYSCSPGCSVAGEGEGEKERARKGHLAHVNFLLFLDTADIPLSPGDAAVPTVLPIQRALPPRPLHSLLQLSIWQVQYPRRSKFTVNVT